jgi:hypothetical protein
MGNEQSAANFANRIDGPFPGSPFWTEARAQVGRPGTIAKVISEEFRAIG